VFRIRDPISGIRKKPIPDPGSGPRGQKGTGSRIRIRNTGCLGVDENKDRQCCRVPDPWHFGTNPDPAPDPALFVSDLHRANKKSFFSNCLLLFEGAFTSFFKDKMSYRSHKRVEIKVFLTAFP
jgi:hypothetical protein